MAELGVEMEQGEKSPERDPLYRLGEADAKGYYDGKGKALQELREMRRIWPIRAYYLSWYSLDSTLTLTEHDKRIQRLADGAGLLGAVKNGDLLDRLGKCLHEMLNGEGTV